MASPGKIPTFAWNGLDTISPRLEGSRPPQALRICTGLGKPFPPSCTLFLSAAGLGALLPRTVRHRVRHTKEKPPMALVGLTLGVGQSWNQYANQRENLPIPKPHKPTKNIGGCHELAFPTVATPLTMPILPEDLAKCQPLPKKTYKLG